MQKALTKSVNLAFFPTFDSLKFEMHEYYCCPVTFGG